MLARRTKLDELAARAGLPIDTLRQLLDLGVIEEGPEVTEEDLAELRRVQRLIGDLGLDHEAVLVILCMRKRMLAMQRELARLRSELRRQRRPDRVTLWIEAEWSDS
ncbi:MAG: chaperone modulator CbpM [Oscillochloridaceae bacterium]|nr:chaperone modulator CbpM [Oscillochloridaceae bacterium]